MRRYRTTLAAGLGTGEELRSAYRVVLGAAVPPPAPETRPGRAALGPVAMTGRGMWGPGTDGRLERKAARGGGRLRVRVTAARALGFPAPSGVFILGVSDRRLLVWRASPLLARPGPLVGGLPIGDVEGVIVGRRRARPVATVVLGTGARITVEPLWQPDLAHLAADVDAAHQNSPGHTKDSPVHRPRHRRRAPGDSR